MADVRRFRLALAALAAAAASAGFVVFAVGPLALPRVMTGEAFAPRQVCPDPIPLGTSVGSARRVGAMFVRTAVLRRDTVCSYDLVTPRMRQGLTRKQWKTGNIPVQPFPTKYPQEVRAEVVPNVARAGERGAWVMLEAADLGRAVFELVVVKRGGRWLVDYWAPAPGAAASAYAAAP